MTDITMTVRARPFDNPHRFLRSMNKRIANFGMELEMLAQGDCGNEGPYEVDCECGAPCCQGSYEAEGEGMNECGEELVRIFRKRNLIQQWGDQCSYHCRCGGCRHDRTPDGSNFLAFQSDCTVGAEFVSRIVHVNEETDHMIEVDRTVAALKEYYSLGLWRPDGYEAAGGHIHVSWNGTDNGGPMFRNNTKRQAGTLINAAYAAYDWSDVADGDCGRMRDSDHSTKPGTYSGPETVCGNDAGDTYERVFSGSWFSNKGNTGEHRLWNMPLDPYRLYAHIGISLALTRWAYATVLNSPEHRWWIMDTSGPDMVDHFRDNHRSFIEQVSLYVPNQPRFGIATETLNLLRW